MGTAISSARANPAVAIATVRQVSRATSSKNSGSTLGGTKSARNLSVDLSVPGSNITHGLNSVSTSAGHSNSSAASAQNTRPRHAGSRNAGRRGKAKVLLVMVRRRFSGNA